MDPEKHQRIEEIFLAAVEVNATRRAAFCDRACGDDRQMREELDRWLEGHERAERAGFLDDAAWRLKSSHPSTQEAEMIGKTIDQYEIQQKIGEKAGMGDVYLAVERSRGEVIRTVVIKFAQERLEADDLKRFEDEVRILARLEHNHIARMYNFGVFEAQPYFVMEHLDGVSLLQFLREEGKGRGLAPDVVNEINKQACAALQFAHDKGVIHRDIKPQNIMITRPGGQLQVKVIDFGIAKASFGLTRAVTAGVIGTPNYLSPEQISSEHFGPVDRRADIYAMGLVVHEMLTGRMVATGVEAMALIQKHLNETPPSPGIGPEVDRVVMTALKKKPGERQATIGEFAAQLDSAIHPPVPSPTPRPIPSPIPSPPTEEVIVNPVRPPAPVRKWAWAMAAVLALAVTAGLVKTIWPTGAGNPGTVAPQSSPPVAVTLTPTPVVITEPPPARPPARPPALMENPKLTLFRLRNRQTQVVAGDTIFRNGDTVGFRVESPHDGFLYLVQQGSSGWFSVLIPDKGFPADSHRVKGGKAYTFPPGGARFRLDDTPGVETIHVFMAKEKTDPLAAAIERSSAGNKRDSRGQALLDDDAVRLLAAASKPDGANPAVVQILKLTHK